MKNNYFKNLYISSFDKNYYSKITLKSPEKYKEIEQFSELKNNLITSGSNFSYAPLGIDSKSLVLDMKKFNRILHFDKKKKEITVEAGIKISEFLNFTLDHDLWIPQLPGYPYITLGGAVATNSHGKSSGTDGTIRRMVKKIIIYHKDHGWLNLSNEENQEIFNLTIGGLGLTGTIVSITFQLEDFIFKDFITIRKKMVSVKDCLIELKKNILKDTFVYSWNMAQDFENFGKGYFFESKLEKNILKKKIKIPKKKNIFFPSLCLWNKFTIKLANLFFYKLQSLEKSPSQEEFLKVIFPYVGKELYFKMFGSKGLIESQLLVAENKLEQFLDEFKFFYKSEKPLITLFSLKNMSGEQAFIRFEGNRICVTFDFVNNKKNLNFLKILDKLCIKYGILPSIIKDSRIDKITFDKCYIYADEFREKLIKFDKKRIYKSEVSRRLEI